MIKLAVLGTLLATLTGTGVVWAAADGPVVDQLIVRFTDNQTTLAERPGAGSTARDLELPDGRLLTVRRRLGSGSLVYALPKPVSRREARVIIERLSARADVDLVEVDERVRPAYVPSDHATTLYNLQWYLHSQSVEPFSINMEDAWDVTLGDSGSVVAVLDSGILTHTDMNAARILPGYDFISDPFNANDGGGRDPDPSDPGDWALAGECGTNDPSTDQPSSWHGLLVTGVIAAESENGIAIEGIDFNTSILPVRVLGKCNGHVSDIIDAMRWAVGESRPDAGTLPVAQRARVINLSLSTVEAGGCPVEEQNAINYVRAHGAVVVTAAGNESGPALDHSPGNCQGVINVGASTRAGELAGYSNYGSNVDFVAPGGSLPLDPDGVLTLSNAGSFSPTTENIVYAQGTSLSTAQTSAIAGMILAVNPLLTPDQVADILCATAQSLPCSPGLCGKGLLDANGALVLAQMSVSDISVITAGSCPAEKLNTGDSIFFKPAGGGGGGCVAAGDRAPDPLFGLILPALAWFRRRARRHGDRVTSPGR